jgi:diaminopropionate ammonia-lyase
MIISNPWYGKGLPDFDPSGVSVAVDAPLRLLQHCPVAQATPLANCSDLAKRLGLAGLHVKDERTRMRLGSFKALGAAYAIAKQADAKRAARGGDMPWEDTLKREVFVTASAGNHGLSVAAGARIFGAKAVIFLSESVPGDFADRLRSFGAEVVISGKTYEDSMSAALDRVKNQGGQILSDTTWPECYTGVDIMEGYLVMAAEAFDAIDTPPTHLFLQAGVGGLAAAVAAYARQCYGDAPRIIVVEPDAAPALMQAVEKGRVVSASGDVSIMGRLDCKEASEVALAGLAAHANDFMTISDADCTHLIAELEDYDLATSPSGGAGYAGMRLAMDQGLLDLNDQSRVLLFLSEGPIDA